MTTARSEVQWKTPNSSDVMYNKEDEKYSAKKGYFIEPFKRITSHCKREECSKRSSRYLKSASVFCVRAVVAAAATTVPALGRSLARCTYLRRCNALRLDGRTLVGGRPKLPSSVFPTKSREQQLGERGRGSEETRAAAAAATVIVRFTATQHNLPKGPESRRSVNWTRT